jgi:hypothetical protein
MKAIVTILALVLSISLSAQVDTLRGTSVVVHKDPRMIF